MKHNRYPSQYEAELVLETNQALNNIHTGYASECNTARYINNWADDLRAEFNAVFNSPESSPWEVVSKYNKPTVSWRKNWDKS